MAESKIKTESKKRHFATIDPDRGRRNRTGAAKKAEYPKDRQAPVEQATEMLKDPAIMAEIDSRIRKAGALQAEVLIILLAQARGDMKGFMSEGPGR